MAVWLKKITVENLGPLVDQTFNLDRFNLIYGENETGKTFLVEWIIQSLFRHAASWNLREITGRGIVTLQGLHHEGVEFSPDSSRKLEDFWEDDESGLPANMARLLVVKGSQLDLSPGAPGGVGRPVLKNALSRETLLDELLSTIQHTVQNSVVNEGNIVGEHRGKLKERSELEGDLRHIQNLVEKVEQQYSRGPVRTLELRLSSRQSSLELQRQAKRHYAYQLDAERQNLQSEREALPDEKLETLRDLIRDYRTIEEDLAQKNDALQEKESASQHYLWLKNALETWTTHDLDQRGPPSHLYAAAGLFLTAVGVTAGLIVEAVIGLGIASLGILTLVYYLWRITTWIQSAPYSRERENIKEEFQARFGEKLAGLTALKTRLDAVQETHIQAEQLQEDIADRQQELRRITVQVEAHFKDLTGADIPREAWQEQLQQLRDQARSLEKRIQQLEINLGKLGVDKDHYRQEPVPETYDPDTLQNLQNEVDELNAQIQAERDDLHRLKQNICSETGDDINTPWNEILQHLYDHYHQTLDEFKSLTAEILAKIGITRTLERVRKEEDEKIRQGLQSPQVTDILRAVREDKLSLELEDEQLIAVSEYGAYPLQDMSTGAREQIQLALRMGFASRLAGGEPLFMILDDAFQHSDWVRRQRLVKKTIELARQNWQITYLTMDDHLRDLFMEAGERIFSDEFTYHTLD